MCAATWAAGASPVLLGPGRVLAVERGCSALHSIGRGEAGTLFLSHATARQLQHRPLRIGREVGRHNSWGPRWVLLGLKIRQEPGKLDKDFKQLISTPRPINTDLCTKICILELHNAGNLFVYCQGILGIIKNGGADLCTVTNGRAVCCIK